MRWLVVDADPRSAELSASELRAEGCEVAVVGTARRAMELLMESRVDAIVADVFLPRVDGFELCAEVQRNRLTSSTPFFLMSSLNDSDERALAERIGARTIIEKPLSRDGIAEIAACLRPAAARESPGVLVEELPLVMGTPIGPPQADLPATFDPSTTPMSCERCERTYSLPDRITDGRQLVVCPVCLESG